MPSVKSLILFYIAGFLFVPMAWANFSISPMSQEITPKQKTVSYTLKNLTSQKAAYEITVLTRELLLDGKEKNEETKELRVFPSKLILAAGQKKRIKVLYLGARQRKMEKSYRVIFKQTDLDVSKQQVQGAKIKYEFVTALYVVPNKAASMVENEIKDKGKYLQLVLHNSGNKHQILQDWKLKLFNAAGESQLYTAKLPAINLLANSQISLELAAETGFKGVSRAEVLVE